MKVSLISSVLINGDAISTCAREKLIALRSAQCRTEFETEIFVYRCDLPELGANIISSVSDLIYNSHFRKSKVVIYEFGIYYELFNSIFTLSPDTVSFAHYHNVTPAQFVRGEIRPTIVRSMEQKANLLLCDEIFCDSELNRSELTEYGVSADRLSILSPPLCISELLGEKNCGSEFKILFVGRFVPSKGIRELIIAFEKFATQSTQPTTLRLVGSLAFSDKDYLQELQDMIKSSKVSKKIVLVGEVSDAELEREYQEANLFVMPSYHEGFCVPVVEAYANGCGVLAFDSGNLPDIVGNLGQTVPTGHISALSDGLLRAAEAYTRDSVLTAEEEIPVDQFVRLSKERAKPYLVGAYGERFLKLLRGRISLLKSSEGSSGSSLSGL